MKQIIGFVFALVFSAVSWAEIPAKEGEYAFVAPQIGDKSYQQYLNELEAPLVFNSRHCPNNNGKCWPVIKNGEGEILKSYRREASVTRLASGRYKNQAYLYYSVSYKSGNKTITNYYVTNDKGRTQTIEQAHASGSLDRIVNADGKVLTITKAGLVVDGRVVLAVTSPLRYAKFGSDPQGKLAMIGIDQGGFIHVSDMKSWLDTGEQLARRGDRNGVLSVYPAREMLYYSVYKYVNSYNKGLVFGRVDMPNQRTESGWLFNSELANVGFDPSVYERDDNLVVSAQNASSDSHVHFIIPRRYDAPLLASNQPLHINGFEQEKTLELMLGAGVASLAWEANADVTKDKTTYAKTKYDIGDSLYKSYWIQGKYDSTQLALTYTRNEAEKQGGQIKEASNFLNAVVDFNGFFSPQSSLRLKMEQGNVGGIAQLSANATSGATLLNPIGSVEFETKLQQYAGLVMGERGRYAGLVYESYQMPGMLGFSDSTKQVTYVGYDPKTRLTKLALVYGYDELDYVRRYENNISRFYTDWLIGIGWVDVAVSNDLKRELRDEGKKLVGSGAIALDGKIDWGYIHQQKIKKWRGAGYALTAGYRLKAGYMTSGQSDESKTKLDADEIALEFGRWDVWHGFYASVNLVY